MLNAGVKINVIPDQAEAFLDCRLLPDTEGDEFLAYIEALDDPEMEVDVFMDMERGPASPADGAFIEAIQKVIADDYPDAISSPFMLSGLSDRTSSAPGAFPATASYPPTSGSWTWPASTAWTKGCPSRT